MASWYFGTIFVVLDVASHFFGYSQWFGVATLCFSGLLLDYFWKHLKTILTMIGLASWFGIGDDSTTVTFVTTCLHIDPCASVQFGLNAVQLAVQFVVQSAVQSMPLYAGCCFIDIVNGTSGFLRNICQRIQKN